MPDLVAILENAAPDLSKFPDGELGDPKVGPELPGLAMPQPLSYETPELQGLTFVASASAELQLRVFNSLDDEDPDGVLLPAAAKGTLALDTDGAWLRTALEVAVKASGGGSVRNLAFDVDARSSLALLHYRRHERQQKTRAAVMSQLLAPRTVLRIADITALRADEAVALRVRGRLSAQVEVNWADVVAGSLSRFVRLAGTGNVLPVKLSLEGTAKVQALVDGDFMVVFTRAREGVCQVTVRKASGRSLEAGAGFKIGAQLADPKAVGQVANAVLAGILRRPLARVDALLQLASGVGLTEEQAADLHWLTGLLGLDGVQQRIDAVQDQVAAVQQRLEALRQRVPQLREQIGKELMEAAATRVSVGFGYEYSRVTERTALLVADIPHAELPGLHRQLLQARTAGVRDAASQPGSQISVVEDFSGRADRKKSNWGFALDVGKWRASGRDRRETNIVEERRGTELRRSYVGLGGYSARLGGEAWEWVVDFSATMPAYSPRPLVSEYECGLSLTWEAHRDRLSEEDLRRALDIGVLWGALPQTEIDEITEHLHGAVGRSVSVETGLRFDPSPFERMLPALMAADDNTFGAALGAAMPWRNQAGRLSPAERRTAYAPLWQHYLGSPGGGTSHYAAIADRYFAQVFKAPSLRALEASQAARSQTFCGLVELNPRTAEGWQAFRTGVRRLQEATARGDADNGLLPAVYGQISQLWRQSHHVHALGDLLLQCAARAGVAEQVERVVRVTVDEKEVELLTS